MRRLAITTGDPDGVGPEVTAKTLRSLGPQKQVQFIVFRSSFSDSLFHSQRLPFQRVSFPTLQEALKSPFRSNVLLEVVNSSPSAEWVEESALFCLQNQLQGMITGPLSKTSIAESGRRDIGHTEILSRVCGGLPVIQGYLGRHFHVVLATAHLPLSKVSAAFTPEQVRLALQASTKLLSLLPKKSQTKPLAWVGLNPHAGEAGLLGTEELWISSILKRQRKVRVEGPLVPDAAFRPQNWKKYSIFIASYHDQGLIPFKMIHGQSEGAQISLGLPFVRTSVDHGTAKDIAGKNKANPGSMKDALQWGLRLTKGMSCINR